MNPASRNIYLIGPMGSGKTTIGLRLAAELKLEFHDCDKALEAHTGASVGLIFDVEGEKGFRARETKMLKKLSRKKGVLVATGGGSVLSKANRDVLGQSGTVVYLETSVSQQLSRLRRDKSRPLLRAPDREEKLHEMSRLRNPLYESIADITYCSTSRSIAMATDRLVTLIREYWQQNSSTHANDHA